MTRLLLVRHGESEWNAAGSVQGHGGSGLRDRGRAQPAATARFLADAARNLVAIARSETFAELRERVWAALRDLAGTEDRGTVVVFTHGGPIRVAIAAALSLPPLGERLLAPVANCSVTELAMVDGQPLLHSYNRFDHLDL